MSLEIVITKEDVLEHVTEALPDAPEALQLIVADAAMCAIDEPCLSSLVGHLLEAASVDFDTLADEHAWQLDT